MSASRRRATDRDTTARSQHGRAGALIVRAVGALLAVALLGLHGCADARAPRWRSRDAFTAHLDEAVPRLMERYDVPGASIALVGRARSCGRPHTAWPTSRKRVR
ncbi:hypothetical protein MX659_02255 [Coriobacteriia bacterium Es71-Z0120]|uniref:hypothetical protein n=1 Tax=Parvivirga hydrogeniphila TaxID=2939460 RepID=UPI0022609E1B|nr:hypothetical protein [Parvivirga hydrogeniphila]MCL4078426.1 hypothetical protein [Parvivirga hydrogeniphila]